MMGEGNLTTYGRQNKALQYAAADLTDGVGFGLRERRADRCAVWEYQAR